eukprot:3663449-Prymnesium_polylepis.1
MLRRASQTQSTSAQRLLKACAGGVSAACASTWPSCKRYLCERGRVCACPRWRRQNAAANRRLRAL